VTTEAGSAELEVTALALIDRLHALRGALHPIGDFHMQHDDFARRAGDFAGYLGTAVDLINSGRFAPAYALVRSGFDHWATDLTVMLGDRFVQHYTNATQATLDDAVDRWRRGELQSVVEEPRLIGKGNSKLRIVRRGLTSEDGSIVLHPMYFEADHFDPFFGPPDEQAGFADWLGDDDARDHATEQRRRYNAFFTWGALLDSLELNGLLAARHRLQLNVHYRFLSAFVHSHHAAHRLLDTQRAISRTVPGHAERELGLLYVVQLCALYLDAFLRMAPRPPAVEIDEHEEVSQLVAIGRSRAQHLWFVDDAPQLFDRGQEVLARTASDRRFGGDGNAAWAALAVEEVRYYRNPLERLRRMHEPAREITTGFVYLPPWDH
jgi:hypothetical protein